MIIIHYDILTIYSRNDEFVDESAEMRNELANVVVSRCGGGKGGQ